VARIWQANIRKRSSPILPVNGQVQETGDLSWMEFVDFPAAEIVLEFLDPSADGEEGSSMFPHR
jgi:2-methylaconitate cis-trans-isomerase PrpF